MGIATVCVQYLNRPGTVGNLTVLEVRQLIDQPTIPYLITNNRNIHYLKQGISMNDLYKMGGLISSINQGK